MIRADRRSFAAVVRGGDRLIPVPDPDASPDTLPSGAALETRRALLALREDLLAPRAPAQDADAARDVLRTVAERLGVGIGANEIVTAVAGLFRTYLQGSTEAHDTLVAVAGLLGVPFSKEAMCLEVQRLYRMFEGALPGTFKPSALTARERAICEEAGCSESDFAALRGGR